MILHDGELRLLTAEEVAAALQLSRAGVYALARRGELPAVRIGASVRFRPAAVVEWLMSREAKGDDARW